jgi:hypothetical protein
VRRFGTSKPKLISAERIMIRTGTEEGIGLARAERETAVCRGALHILMTETGERDKLDRGWAPGGPASGQAPLLLRSCGLR